MGFGIYANTSIKIHLGQIGNISDQFGTLHQGCVVVSIEQDGQMTLYSPNFKETITSHIDLTSFKSTNGRQDSKSRKINFQYALQHAEGQLDHFSWQEN